MTISWLTALNSSNICICVMNLNRHSYTIVEDVQRFVLNVPTSGENLVFLLITQTRFLPRLNVLFEAFSMSKWGFKKDVLILLS